MITTMEEAVAILMQLVNWPLAALVARRAVRGEAHLASWATVALLVSGAVAAWDTDTELLFAQVAIAVTNSSLALLFAVYPDGRFVPRWIVVPALLEIVLQVGNLASGFAWEYQSWWPWHFVATWGALVIGGQIFRYRSRSSVDERERTRWPVLGIVIMILAFSIWSFVALGLGDTIGDGSATWLTDVFVVFPGVGFAVGLLAPRIRSVDGMLRLVLAWGLWILLLSGSAWGLSLTFAGLGPGPTSWLTGLCAGGLAIPALWCTRRLADLVVYGRRTDVLHALNELGKRLEASVDLSIVPAQIAETMTTSLGLAGARVRSAPGLSATSGRPPREDATDRAEFAIRYQGDLVATLVVLPRPGDRHVMPDDRQVIEQLCRQAAPALHGARVMAELIEARTRIVHAREEERKRLRRDLHDDLAPSFAGLGLSAAAVEAFSRAGDERAADAAALLVAGLHAATRQLRDVAYDLRPPVLDDRGLVAAVEERVTVPGSVPFVRVDAPTQSLELPAAVELAALRVVQEAVANVRRHAAAELCVVSITVDADVLRVAISDDGTGFADSVRPGVGLRSMHERVEELRGSLHIGRGAAGGTTVAATFPLRTDVVSSSATPGPLGGSAAGGASRVPRPERHHERGRPNDPRRG